MQGTRNWEKLLQLIIDQAFSNGKTEQLVLSVASANSGAIKLYKQFGFAEYGRLENFFKSGAEYFSRSFFYLMKPETVKRETSSRNRKTDIVSNEKFKH